VPLLDLDPLRRRLPLAPLTRFCAQPLLFKPSGEKLSKAVRHTGIRDLRAGGARPEDVLGEAAVRAGLLPERRPIRGGGLAGLL
jgi:hypothetical protein